MRAEGMEPEVRARAGLPLDPYFSASKLAWILRMVPQAQALHRRGRLRLGTTDAFFRDRLTGRFETDATTASRTSLMNLATCTWDAELCALFGVPVETLPAITRSTGDLGALRAGGQTVALTASLVDQQAALYGHGCRVAGDAKITFGTGAFALAVTGDRPALAGTQALPTVAWHKAGEAPVFALDGGVYAASSAVNWAQGIRLFDDLADLDRLAGPTAAERGLVFVPALAGLACPHWNRAARGAWMGLSLDTTRADMAQAVLEGIAFRMAEVVEDMARAVPVGATLSIDGGMSANPRFCQMLADTLGRALVVSGNAELTAQGTAWLAAEATGARVVADPVGTPYAPRPFPPAARAAFARARDAVIAYGRGT
jgi:glycerol kinase